MKKLIPFLISGVLAAGIFGCQEAPKTSSENSTTTSESAQAPAKEASQTTETTAKNATEKTKSADTTTAKNATEKTKPADATTAEKTKPVVTAGSDNVKTLALDKLKEKLPSSNLVVDNKEGVVTVTGTVPTEADLKQIEPIVKQLNGVKSVKVEAKVATEKKP